MESDFASIFTQMIVLFSIVGVGYAAKRFGLLTHEFDKNFSKLVLYTALPAMILASVLAADELPAPDKIAQAFLLSCLSYVVLGAVAFLVTKVLRISNGHKGVFRFMMIFGNVGFIGFPVLQAIFGSQALIYAAIFNLPFNFLVFTFGVWLLTLDAEGEVDARPTLRTFLSPCMISCVIAIVLALLGVHGVPVLGEALDTMGSMTTPAALLIVGSSLANLPVRELMGGGRLVTASVFRLVITPIIVLLCFGPFVSDKLVLGILVVISGMPVATNGTMLCYQYGGNARDMAQGTFVTTVLSLVTIPFLVLLVQTFA